VGKKLSAAFAELVVELVIFFTHFPVKDYFPETDYAFKIEYMKKSKFCIELLGLHKIYTYYLFLQSQGYIII
jgi:hypothetical protein